jgi:membrane-associated phospholipid phosphatase
MYELSKTYKKFPILVSSVAISIFLYLVTICLGIFIYLYPQSQLVLLDERIVNILYIFRSEVWVHFFYFITLFAEIITVFILTIIVSLFLLAYKQRVYLFSLWFILILGEGVTFVGKHIFQRARPDVLFRVVTENSFSFPSGHATAVVLFYGFIVYLIIRNFKSLVIKIISVTSFIALILLIDMSRLYLGVHYLTDVVAGNLIGLATLILGIGITEWIISNKQISLSSL